MLIDAERSALLVVDVQEKLLRHVLDWQALLDNVIWLVQVANKIGVPVMATEQYPKGLGHTTGDLLELIPQGAVADKVHFSCVAGQCLGGLAGNEREQIIVCGMEAYVCVLQTVIELREQGKQVFVVADAVGSRRSFDRGMALDRMRSHGIQVVSREMVAFEWLRRAGTQQFKEISLEFLR